MRAELRLSPAGSGASFATKTFVFDQPATLEIDGHIHGLDFTPAPAPDNAILPSYALAIDQDFVRYDGSSFTLKSVPWHSDSVCVNGRLLGDHVYALSDGDKLLFGKYVNPDFEIECAVRVHLSFPTPPAPVLTTTNWPGIRKLIADIRDDQAQDRHTAQDRHSEQTPRSPKAAERSPSRIPTSVPTSVLRSSASSIAPVTVPKPTSLLNSSRCDPTPQPPSPEPFQTSLPMSSSTSLPNSPIASIAIPRPSRVLAAPPYKLYGTLVAELRSFDATGPAPGLPSPLPTIPRHATRADASLRSEPRCLAQHVLDEPEAHAKTVDAAEGAAIGIQDFGVDIKTDGRKLNCDLSVTAGHGARHSSSSVASAVLAVERARSAWTVARTTLFATGSPGASTASFSSIRMRSIDLALNRLRAAWHVIQNSRTRVTPNITCSSNAPVASTPASDIKFDASSARKIGFAADTPIERVNDRDHSFERNTTAAASASAHYVHPQPPTTPVSTLHSRVDLNTILIWHALFVHVTVLLYILAFR